ncbi:MAG: hypothetical protein JSV17_10450 [Candidatus Aminicenantes bacterium]|nr:MAG: hypothetical protein JSV17_10450 [Candidatus Aminicenantes bacterium]
MKAILTIIFIPLLLYVPSVLAGHGSQEALTDIDGNTYKVIKIGDQVWMAENLRVTKDRDGNAIQSYCLDDDKTNCEKLGRLYTWDVALKVSPKGWHLPSNEEWKVLIDYLGGESEAGQKLLEGGSSGFEALLAGAADFRGNYLYLGEYAIFWTSSEANQERAYHQGFKNDGHCDLFAAMKGARISIRLIKDDQK